jgi:ATP-dependent DNA helicase MPH1
MGVCPSCKAVISGAGYGLPRESLSCIFFLSRYLTPISHQIEASMGMCHTHLQELSHRKDDDGQESKKAQKLSADPKFQAVMTELETQRTRGFSFHPKMDRLKGLILQHFADRTVDENTEEDEGTRAMVFVTYRECVDEIVEMLNAEKPLIRATKFVGQGTDKQGKRGFAQKEQLEVGFSPIFLSLPY